MPFLNVSASRWLVCCFWLLAACVGVLSLMPPSELPAQVFSIWDKAQHAVGFLVLTVLGLAGHPRRASRVIMGLMAYGAAIEFAQTWSGWRSGDPQDWLADAAGILAGAALVRFAATTKT